MEQDQVQQEAPTQELPPLDVSEVAQEAAPEKEEVEPTKSIKNFWERLDEVFSQNSEIREKINEVVEQFPSEQRVNIGPYRSYIFQPERVCLSSNEDVSPSQPVSNLSYSQGGHQASETFSSFRIRLQRSLVNVKSIQLLSCVIPNAVQNIPDDSVIFYYYKLRTVTLANKGAYVNTTNYLGGDIVTFMGNTFACKQATTGRQPTGVFIDSYWVQISLPANGNSPNYYDLHSDHLEYLYLPPTFATPVEEVPLAQQTAYNRTFTDYGDLVTSLNSAAQFYATIPNDVTFAYNPTLNKIQFIPSPSEVLAGYFYLPAGYEDPNIPIVAQELLLVYPGIFTQGYTLNLRCGFTWNGLFPNPFMTTNPWANNTFANILYYYMRPYDPNLAGALVWTDQLVTFNSYPDLVNTSCVRIYTDVSLASTEEGQIQNQQARDGILSIVPVNTTNLGVGFYQNTMVNQLTKVPRIISEIGFSLYTDQGKPYLLPNSATVLLELGITYY